MKRKEKQLAYGGTVIQLEKTDSVEQIVEKAVTVQPAKRQIEWQALEFTAFIHFGINTYTDREWGDGTESPTLFNPVEFDAKQWVRAMNAAHMKGVILTCKHHDGFCLWPSKYTEHSVKNSPWKNGHGDVVKEVSDACREFDMKFGIYLSPWDRHEESYGDSDRYNTYYRNQLTELLTQYGEIFEVWLDGACAEGSNGKKQIYDWRSYYALVRKLQPQATITGMGPDARWCGNESGIGRTNEWSVVPVPEMEDMEAHESDRTAAAYPKHNYTLATAQDLGSRPTLEHHAASEDWVCWYPSQVDVSLRPGWFYHKAEDSKVKSLKHMMQIYYDSVGGNAQLLLNLPPTPEGLIHTKDVSRLKEVGEVIQQTFKDNVLENSVQVITNENGIQNITFTLEETFTFNTLMLQEDIREGQRVEEFVVEIEDNEGWKEICKGNTIGYKKLIKIKEDGFVTTKKMRICITQSRAIPVIYKIGAFKAPIIID
ncbi:MAG: alpha-L-fucosidase [Niameybacter sp.]